MPFVIDEHGSRVAFAPARLASLLTRLSSSLSILPSEIKKILKGIETSLPEEISVHELLGLAAESLAQKVTEDPDFSDLAGRVEACRINRRLPSSFSQNFQLSRDYVHEKTGEKHPLVSEAAYNFVSKYAESLDDMIVHERDYNLSFFGIRTLENSYLLKRKGLVAENPQYLFMRVAVGIHGMDVNLSDEVSSKQALLKVHETYEAMSTKHFVHSSPTLFNAATENPYLSSCFLLAMEDDSIDGIYKTLHQAALISKGSGGIGVHMHNIRSSGSLIKSSNGSSNGLVPMLRVFNNTARYVDQGGNKRPGAIAVYLEPWHGDIQDVLDLRKNHGPEEMRARDLFYALWIPDLFMKRVENDENWSLFSPSEAPGLSDVYGDDFNALYQSYEAKGLASSTIPARKLWLQILDTQIETGMPFMLYKDACNRKSNQQNLGTIKSSNLCCEIVEYSSEEETAVCNLGSLGLPSFVESSRGSLSFDFSKLHKYTKVLARNLDKVIDVTKYPTGAARRSNMKHRPIAIGVQGLADTFMELRLPFESAEAELLNRQIFETIYHGAVEASVEMATESGMYSSFPGSPASQGKLQFDLWNHKPDFFDDWDALKEKVKKHGLRNSLLVAPMPTASTSSILGFNECFEPFTSNLYSRRVLSGEYQMGNKYLIRDLKDLGIWNNAIKQKIVMDNGSIQNIDVIPEEVKKLYKTVWEISQKKIVNMAADRGCFIDQSQSMNIFMKSPTIGALNSCHFYAWKKELKTGMYYLRTQAASRPIQFTVDENSTIAALAEMTKPAITNLKREKYEAQTLYPKHPVGSEDAPESTKTELPRSKRPREASRNTHMRAHHIPAAPPHKVVRTDSSISSKPVRSTKHSRAPAQPSQRADHSLGLESQGDAMYNIFDTTPRLCEIRAPDGCDSCSG